MSVPSVAYQSTVPIVERKCISSLKTNNVSFPLLTCVALPTHSISDASVDNTTQIIRILEVRDPEPKTFKETKGIVTSGYQNEIEAQWIEDLRAKYIVTVNEKLLDKIIKKYNN